jgi:Ran GTPase-activating protein (RanGAP) involved in mRNA processing and transport
VLQLDEADLSDIIAGRHESEALRVLEIVCNSLAGRRFKSIDLSDNALGEKVRTAVARPAHTATGPPAHPCPPLASD